MMKNSNESNTNIFHRFINSTIKFTRELTNEFRSKSPTEKFQYELPDSFLKAVDKARLTAGYDILPRHRPRSASPTIYETISSSSDCTSDQYITPSSSTNDINRILTKKVPFRRRPAKQIPTRPRQQMASPRFFSPRTRFPMMMNPNLMMLNRTSRPTVHVLPIRMQSPQPINRLRFR